MTEVPLDNGYMISENNLDFYGFTINVSTNKYYNKVQWRNYTPEQQEQIILECLDEAVQKLNLPMYEYYFELTKRGHTHLHGLVQTSESKIFQLQYFIGQSLGLPKMHPCICFKFTKTVVDVISWRKYMHKNNPEYKWDNQESPKSPGDDIDFVD